MIIGLICERKEVRRGSVVRGLKIMNVRGEGVGNRLFEVVENETALLNSIHDG